MITIDKKIQGNLNGIKKAYLEQLESLYDIPTEPGQLASAELLERMVSLTGSLNREIAVYVNRKGQVVSVAVGENDQVSLAELNLRRGSHRLSKLHCIHTHPGASGRLSGVDLAALHRLRFDCMGAIGVVEGKECEVWVGYINPADENQPLLVGPMSLKQAAAYNFLTVVSSLEKQWDKEVELNSEGPERAIVVGVEQKGEKLHGFSAKESLQELAHLARAAGAVVVREILQSKDKVDAAYYVGRGLVEKLKLLAQDLGADLIIFDTELSGTQLRNLERKIGKKILDRTGLILDIFAQRARTKEGKLQVELAQLEYLLPRLSGVGKEMSRLAGGIGTRGPGETKLEKDRRHIRKRIFELRNELEQVKRQREILKTSRPNNLPLIALVGYTNAGKSTLRYRLLKETANRQIDWEKEERGTDKLFATLDPTVRGIVLPDGQPALLADTVGFIQRLPHQLISAFKATLEEVVYADLLLHVVDAYSPNRYEQMEAVERVLEELNALNKKMILVYNKVDLLEGWEDLLPHPHYPTVWISAAKGIGIKELLQEITVTLGLRKREVRLAIPHNQAKILAEIYQKGKVKEVEYGYDYVYLCALIDVVLYQRLKKYEVSCSS